jgi:hypothetical protein
MCQNYLYYLHQVHGCLSSHLVCELALVHG